MMKYVLISVLLITSNQCRPKEQVSTSPDQKSTPKLSFYINQNVINANEEEEAQVIALWQDYLKSKEFQTRDGRHWNYEHSIVPDQFLWSIQRFLVSESDEKMQNTIIGVFPVDHDHYALKSMFSTVNDTTQQVSLRFIISVYATKINGFYKLVNSTDYHRLVWEKKVVKDITYYIHPSHKFNESQALKMANFSQDIAKDYEMPPLIFDYFVANNTRDIATMMGFDFMGNKYKPDQTGGMAESYNNIILAGNNSEYYPHEVIHLYNKNKFQNSSHTWVDEGIATFYGGSSGYPLVWHLQKLKTFLQNDPFFEIKDLSKLHMDIPNGEFITDISYAIGGLIAQNIYEKEGMQGIFEMLSCGRSDQDYFKLLEEQLGISQETLGAYVRGEVAKL